MCGRYTLASPTPFDVRARFPVGEAVEIRRRYNIAPGDPVLAVTTDRAGAPRGEQLRWGLVPSWANDPKTGYKMINARVETVAERPAFRGAFERMRCLIVADGFYEWQRPETGPKRPFHITRTDGGLFAFAGLWSVWHDDRDASTVRSCTILTTAANAVLAPVHDRMPVILDRDAEAEWLDPGTPRPRLVELLGSLPAEATALRRVGPAVGDARHDAPDCLDPPAEVTGATTVEQPSLF